MGIYERMFQVMDFEFSDALPQTLLHRIPSRRRDSGSSCYDLAGSGLTSLGHRGATFHGTGFSLPALTPVGGTVLSCQSMFSI
jgi:hypothetical protein